MAAADVAVVMVMTRNIGMSMLMPVVDAAEVARPVPGKKVTVVAGKVGAGGTGITTSMVMSTRRVVAVGVAGRIGITMQSPARCARMR